MDSVVEATDVVIKACFIVDLEYCPAVRSSWTFVQVVIFDIKTKFDFMSTRLRELITYLQLDR